MVWTLSAFYKECVIPTFADKNVVSQSSIDCIIVLGSIDNIIVIISSEIHRVISLCLPRIARSPFYDFSGLLLNVNKNFLDTTEKQLSNTNQKRTGTAAPASPTGRPPPRHAASPCATADETTDSPASAGIATASASTAAIPSARLPRSQARKAIWTAVLSLPIASGGVSSGRPASRARPAPDDQGVAGDQQAGTSRHEAGQRQAHQHGEHQGLVGQRIEDRAEPARQAVAAGEESVDAVGEPRHGKEQKAVPQASRAMPQTTNGTRARRAAVMRFGSDRSGIVDNGRCGKDMASRLPCLAGAGKTRDPSRERLRASATADGSRRRVEG